MDTRSVEAKPRDAAANHGASAAKGSWRGLLQHPAWGLAAVALIGFNLRPSISAIALFIDEIRRDFGISALGISFLTMLPVICLGAFAPAVPPLVRRFGMAAVLSTSLIGVVIGSVVRSLGAVPLYLGTVVISASLCFLGVLTPVLVKRDFPHRIGPTMGLYTMLICLGPASAAATVVPMERMLGGNWQLVLVLWSLPCILGALVVVPQFFRSRGAERVEGHFLHLLRDPLAWQVTGYFGLITALAYAVFNWGPAMLEARGLDLGRAGLVMSLCFISQTAAGLLTPIIAGRQRDQRLLLAVMVVLTAFGLAGLVYAPVGALDAVAVLLGFGMGGTFGISLLFFAVRARDPDAAAQLSAMAQTVGYFIGAVAGPFAVGVIYAWTGSWPIVSVFYLLLGVASLVLGLGAGRARFVGAASAS